ncbi:MAG: histidine kinase, partial [Flammeovirgaceae bacterium]
VPSDTLYLVGWEGSYRIVGEQITPLKEINPLFDRRFNDVKGINNRVFFASSTIGVLMLENGKLTQIGRDEGLTSNIVTCITLEDEHHVWVGTNKGLNYIDLTKQPIAITAITAQDGLVSDEVTNIKLFQDTIWVGTKHGLSYFNKADGFLQQIQPTVQLTGVWVNDQEIPHPSNHFELSADENQLTVRYTALLFRAKGTLTYKYRLKGYSDRWRTTQERQLTFSALDDGDYEMEIVAGYRGRWSANPLTIAFRIKPYFWETWWFILVVASLVVLLMYGLYRWRLREAQGKIQLEQKVIELRNEALKAQINPHFAFNSLNSIQKLISEENSKASEIYLAKFGSLLRLVLEHSNQKLIRIADEIQLLETYLELEKLRFKDKLRYQFTIEKEIDIHDYFMPPLLLQPFIENALLHGILPKASGGNINITFKEKGTDQLVCMIVDDGLGINHRKQHKLHGSTSRGLAISKERVESLTSLYKMPCTITITDRKEIDHTVTGTAVEISLPKIYTI